MTNVADLTSVEKIIVLDFGSQFNQLITRRIREFGVFSELLSHRTTAEEIRKIAPKGIIFSGGPNSVYDKDAFSIDPEIYELGIPILGICYGMQLMTHNLGGKVEPAANREYGKAELEILGDATLFQGTPAKQTVWMSHGDLVTEIAPGFEKVGTSNDCPIASIEDANRKFYGVQFHPEVRHSEYGNDLLRHFAFDVCGCTGDWSMENFIDMEVAKIREQVGDKKVLLGLSGGVDSSVVGVLLQKAIGDQLTCIFVDHGLLRKGEAEQVMESLGGKFGLNIIKVDAKRRVAVGRELTKKFEQVVMFEVSQLLEAIENQEIPQKGEFVILIEGAKAQTIKSHHNVGGLPEDMQFELIEPLNTLFKDEVRALGTELGMPDAIVWRQPFPGPGLGIRVLGEITEDKLQIVRDSDAILREEIAAAGLDRDIWQYFTVLPGIRSVGVMGDGRTYDYTVGIRAVTSIDGMTADFARIPWDVLQKISVRIVNEVAHVNRIVYDITSKPPATVEWE